MSECADRALFFVIYWVYEIIVECTFDREIQARTQSPTHIATHMMRGTHNHTYFIHIMLNNTPAGHTRLIQFSFTLHILYEICKYSKKRGNNNSQLAFGTDANTNKTCQAMKFNR